MNDKILMQFTQRFCNLLNYDSSLLLGKLVLSGLCSELPQVLFCILSDEIDIICVFEVVDEA